MSNIIHFTPKSEATAQANLQNFIASCHPLLDAYQEVQSWEQNNWDLFGQVEQNGHGNTRISVVFNRVKVSSKNDDNSLSQPFLDFAKAYFLYTQALRPTKNYSKLIAALRVIEKALTEVTGASRIETITPPICAIAENSIIEQFEKITRYGISRKLMDVIKFLCAKRLIITPFQWKSHISRPHDNLRVGKDADERRQKRLPSQAGLKALPKCFLLATETRDILVTSVAALLCTAPDRISEIFNLPFDCEIEQEYNGKTIYGLRWWPAKGAEPTIKWIAPTMVDVAKQAIAKLKKITQPARDVASWYENHPNSLFLPSELEHLRLKKRLVPQEVADIIGFISKSGSRSWLKQNSIFIKPYFAKTNANTVLFSEVEKVILAKLPRTFPFLNKKLGLRYSKALMIIRANELTAMRGTRFCMIEPISIFHINSGLGSGEKHGKISIFEQFGFTEPDGSSIKITTHQFRHWLNTLAHRGGMSQVDIAMWSSRVDIPQNQAYDQLTSHELIEMTRELTKDDPRLFGPLAELAAKSPLSRDEFLQLEFPTAHVTEIGFCVHDYTMLPCQKHRDCINCNEHICVKGDRRKTQRIKEQLSLAEEQLKRAKEAMNEGCYGADRWHEHHLATVEWAAKRLRDLYKVLEDPNVPEGALIRLFNPREYSPILTAIQDRLQSSPPEISEAMRCLLPTLSGDNQCHVI